MTKDQFVTVSKDDIIGYVTLNRPPANSYNAEVMQHLDAAIDQVRADDDIKAVIVQSAIDRFFSAGADIKAFANNTPEVNTEMVRYAHEVMRRIERTPKIFIAAINGHVLGGGLEIALVCDLRFASDGDFQVGLPEATLGLLPGNGGTQRLPRLIGKSTALDLMITGRTVGPEEALELGIVDRVFAAGDLMSETRAYAEDLANGATLAIGLIKLAINDGLANSLSAGLALEQERISQLFKSEDAQEGFAAFLEKRKPEFKGR